MPRVSPLTQIAPRRIHRHNQLNFLNPKPALNPLFPVNGIPHIVKTLVVNQSVDFVALAKFLTVAELVFPNPPMEIVSDADVKRFGAVGQNVNAIAVAIAKMHESFASLRLGAEI
jgi:hypothetical protein